ncbi:RWD domain-containing protein 2B-like [Gigantopelta aegis]|uniref:RWD domain-containing protein 2B-like n=1 Tax=Gigantopelta aegis TaxID=1735272 RepID=UPI001B88CA98|nr:RWD domain-containing protein 2B-like [Gigantopelta aegis]XP_041368982.1 RWD domain-containing protein 2B-like [Gigantopelta aegis]
MEDVAVTADLKDLLELQLSEVEMLASMFPNPGEFSLDSRSALADVQAFVEGKIQYQYLRTRIGFTVRIAADSNKKQMLELVVHLPHKYPAVAPEVFFRAPQMSRESDHQLNEGLTEFINSTERGEICIGAVVQWLEENSPKYISSKEAPSRTQKTPVVDSVFTRLWVYSHHIYSKTKRRDILDWAHELKVTGFCMPGKPGVICIEGYGSQVEEMWFRIRRMNWKKIAIKEKEDFQLNKDSVESFRKFDTFSELNFEVRGGKGREYHMDLGKFCEFLEQRGCEKIFNIYFGVGGKSVSNE